VLRYTRLVAHLPELARARPFISDVDRERAAAIPPFPVPFHCKPWTDGQTAGWAIPYGYRTSLIVHGRAGGLVSLRQVKALAAEAGVPETVRQPAPGLVALATGYTIHPAPATAALLIEANDPPPGYRLVMSYAASGGAPLPLWVIFRAPSEGENLSLSTGAQLARLVEVPLQPNATSSQLSADGISALQAEEARYLQEERQTPARWTAANGEEFTHLYKIWSRRVSQVRYKDEES
jgi:hypothetical protein